MADSLTMNNVTKFSDRQTVKEEAGSWIVRLDSGDLSEEEYRDLQSWIQKSNFHREYLLKLASNWDAMDVLQELGEMFPLPAKEDKVSTPPKSSKYKTRIKEYFGSPIRAATSIAAMVSGVLLVAVMFWIENSPEQYITSVGDRQSYFLDDGTRVSLNTDTQIYVNYSGSRRVVTLVHGEATFDVAKDVEKPFVVYAGTGLVWAVGTSFNVRHHDGLVDVLVTEGRVKVYSDARPADHDTSKLSKKSLAPEQQSQASEDANNSNGIVQGQREALLDTGESLRYRQVIESVKRIEQEESSRILAWHEGSLVFKGETLEEALAEISRYTDKQLVILDPELKSLRVGGHYRVDDIDALLASLGQGLGVSVVYDANNRILLSGTR